MQFCKLRNLWALLFSGFSFVITFSCVDSLAVQLNLYHSFVLDGDPNCNFSTSKMLLSLKCEICTHLSLMLLIALLLPLHLPEIEGVKMQGQVKTNSPSPTTIFSDTTIKSILMYERQTILSMCALWCQQTTCLIQDSCYSAMGRLSIGYSQVLLPDVVYISIYVEWDFFLFASSELRYSPISEELTTYFRQYPWSHSLKISVNKR